jgi:hypothetical protein
MRKRASDDMSRCFSDFLVLAKRPVTDAGEYLKFAKTWGLLGICEHKREDMGLRSPEKYDFPWLTRWDCPKCSLLADDKVREPLKAWRLCAQQFSASLQIASKLREGVRTFEGDSELVKCLRWGLPAEKNQLRFAGWNENGSPKHELVARTINADRLSRELAECINPWLTHEQGLEDASPLMTVSTEPGYIVMVWTADNLRRQLLARLIAVLSSRSDIRVCGDGDCQNLYVRTYHQKLNKCPDCSKRHRRESQNRSGRERYRTGLNTRPR